MARSGATAVHLPGNVIDARLALVDFLLSDTDLQRSSRRAIDWLSAHSDVDQAVVAIAEPGTGPLLLVAEYGVSSGAIVDFSLSRDEEGHPLVRAMFDGAASVLRGVLDALSIAHRGRSLSRGAAQV